ncbi:hypothetical protein AGOR_G00031360 [Albula goreensis]|uniref:Uncharacterized protein n=1 Tax=Albula goreensis TaxID=1534307 RepID=A0A8T3E578_9TELE|nr:hypothetical protein AGOR_G00031360 [Albula goreensis]
MAGCRRFNFGLLAVHYRIKLTEFICSETVAMRTPVCVLRLPRGPDPNSRGFDPNSPRYIALCPTTIAASSASQLDSCSLQEEQRTRSTLRERYLRKSPGNVSKASSV